MKQVHRSMQACIVHGSLNRGLARSQLKPKIRFSRSERRELASIARLSVCPAVDGASGREPDGVADRKARGLTARSRRGRRGRRVGKVRTRVLQTRAACRSTPQPQGHNPVLSPTSALGPYTAEVKFRPLTSSSSLHAKRRAVRRLLKVEAEMQTREGSYALEFSRENKLSSGMRPIAVALGKMSYKDAIFWCRYGSMLSWRHARAYWALGGLTESDLGELRREQILKWY